MGRLLRSLHVRALAGYGVLSAVFSWPLPLHLRTHLLGPPNGDTGVYVWNLWVFSHELLENGHLPFFTSTIFSLDNRADLSLHNYTVFADLLAMPLLPVLGIVGTFNVLYLLMVVVNGYAMFLLARELGAREWESWLAGALFAFAPCLVARSTAHFSLVMAAPIPVFVTILHRAERQRLWATGVSAGLVLAWAALCDPYYAVYCLALACWHVASRTLTLRFAVRQERPWRTAPALVAATGLVGVLVAWIALTGGGSLALFGARLDMKTLYTPVFVLTVFVAIHAGLWLRPRIGRQQPFEAAPLLRLAPYGFASCSLALSPLLYALGLRAAQGRYVPAPVFWRTSMPGIDLLALVLPNPNHPLFRPLSQAWLTRRPGGYEENVASLTFVALAVLVAAVAWARFRPSRYWAGLFVVTAMIAAGPFFSFAGLLTYIPTPWTLLRYAPVLGGARAPARFMAVTMMAFAALFALALHALGERFPAYQRRGFAVITALLLFELLPAPRVMCSAEVPGIYHEIAADPRDVRVLELPFGVRSGIGSVGNFSSASQFHQTVHHKRLVGGYLSRVSPHRINAIRRRPILNALIELSEGREVSAERQAALKLIAPGFVHGARLGYVVIDRSRASAALAAFAVETLALERIGTSGDRDLYRPRAPE